MSYLKMIFMQDRSNLRVAMNWKGILIISAVLQCAAKREVEAMQSQSNIGQWSAWSSCSATCGKALRWRTRQCRMGDKECSGNKKESKHCFLQFCPSYLSWPRIHFSGTFVFDACTTNNYRCFYLNDEFTGGDLSEKFTGLHRMDGTHKWYSYDDHNWNPDGSNQLYFTNTFVTSFCSAPNACSTNPSIVGMNVIESVRGVLAVLDVDWQKGTEIWAIKVGIPGVLEGEFQVTARPIQATRVDVASNFYISLMGRYNGRLLNVTWHDSYYQRLFNNSKELTMVLVFDLYNHQTLSGRVTGTIGPTSPDDPMQMTASRFLQVARKSKKRGPAPFYFHYDKLALTIDLSYSIGGRQNGSIYASDLGTLDLALLLTKKKYCKHFMGAAVCTEKGNHKSIFWRRITTGGKLSRRIGNDTKWYNIYGGIMDIDLSHLDTTTLKLMRNTRIAILDSNDEVYMQEFPGGITTGVLANVMFRLNAGESETVHAFVSSFGRPLKNAQVGFNVMRDAKASEDCGTPLCNTTLGVPMDAIGVSTDHHLAMTNSSGLAAITMKALRDPGNVRKCGLDGQIYPMQLYTRFRRRKKVLTFSNSGSTGSGLPAKYHAKGFEFAVHIYNSVPVKECPTWQDVKDIFVQYYNLYPVMWKSGVIDLHSYNAIKRKAKMFMTAMFKSDTLDPRYMPTSRDLSSSKRSLIWNWMKCGMKRTEPTSSIQTSTDACSKRHMTNGVKDVRHLLQSAVMLELATIPPYVTAWLSLKTEYGRNTDIAHIIKSVFDEEMLHMTLGGNILNAVGGVVNMTDATQIPVYPAILGSRNSYELCPNTQIGLGPFSIGLAQDVFSKIEQPSNFKTRQVIYRLAETWKNIPPDDALHEQNKLVSKSMQDLINEAEKLGRRKFPQKHIGSATEQWVHLRNLADTALKHLQNFGEKTIGEFYTSIALKLTILESCTKIKYLKNLNKNGTEDEKKYPRTIFTRNPYYQLNMSHWYQQSDDSFLHVMEDMGGKMSDSTTHMKKNETGKLVRPPVFEVTDLKTALEAIVEIVYQGEGGSECSPFVTEPDIYASNEGNDKHDELSHYYRFQEIVNGRTLVKVPTPPPWAEWNCLNVSHPELCPSVMKSGESYCYAGKAIAFYNDGVWPIIFNPKKEDYTKGTKAHRLHHQFNLLYTRLLFCLQETFGGTPSNIQNCMSLMYDLTIVGKRLVQTPLQQTEGNKKREMKMEKHGTPTWLFVREKSFRAGYPVEAIISLDNRTHI